MISVGEGSVIGGAVLMSYADPEPVDVTWMSVSTGWGSDGLWQLSQPHGKDCTPRLPFSQPHGKDSTRQCFYSHKVITIQGAIVTATWQGQYDNALFS